MTEKQMLYIVDACLFSNYLRERLPNNQPTNQLKKNAISIDKLTLEHNHKSYNWGEPERAPHLQILLIYIYSSVQYTLLRCAISTVYNPMIITLCADEL